MAQEAVGAGADDGLVGAGHDVDGEISAQGPEGPPPQADAGPDNRKPDAEGYGVAGKCNGRDFRSCQCGQEKPSRREQDDDEPTAVVPCRRFGSTPEGLAKLGGRPHGQGAVKQHHCDGMIDEEVRMRHDGGMAA